MNPVLLRDLLRGAADGSSPRKGTQFEVLRDEFEMVSTRRLRVQSAMFLGLMGIAALIPNLEHLARGIDVPHAILLLLVFVGFPLAWWVQGRRSSGWSIEKKTAWARRYEFCNFAFLAAVLAVILFSVLAGAGLLSLPSRGTLILCSLVSLPVLALALHFAQRKLSSWLDTDWLE